MKLTLQNNPFLSVTDPERAARHNFFVTQSFSKKASRLRSSPEARQAKFHEGEFTGQSTYKVSAAMDFRTCAKWGGKTGFWKR